MSKCPRCQTQATDYAWIDRDANSRVAGVSCWQAGISGNARDTQLPKVLRITSNLWPAPDY